MVWNTLLCRSRPRGRPGRGEPGDRRPPVEPLERRALLSGAIEPAVASGTVVRTGPTLEITGTEGNDQITLVVGGGVIIVTVNGVPSSELDPLVNDVIIDGLGGDDTIRVKRNTDNAIRIKGGEGDDVIRFGEPAGTLTSIGGADVPIHVEGDGGIDRVEFEDSARPEPAAYSVWSADVFVRVAVLDFTPAPLAPQVTAANIEGVMVLAGAGDDVLRVNNPVSGVAVQLSGGPGDDTFEIDGDGGPTVAPVEISAGAGVNAVQVAPGGLRVALAGSADWAALRVDPGSRLILALNDGDVHRTRAVQLDSGATLDLGRGSAVIDYTGAASPIGQIGQWLQQGRAGGSWLGAGITSSVAAANPGTSLGYGEASELPPAVLSAVAAPLGGGAGAPIDLTSVVIRYTLDGDADLSRGVDIADFSRLAANFNAPSRWTGGDFNYDGGAGIADFSTLAARFNQVLPPTPVTIRPGGVWSRVYVDSGELP